MTIRTRLTVGYVLIASVTLLLVGGVFLVLVANYAERLNRETLRSAVGEILPLCFDSDDDHGTPTQRLATIDSRLRKEGITTRFTTIEQGPPLPREPDEYLAQAPSGNISHDSDNPENANQPETLNPREIRRWLRFMGPPRQEMILPYSPEVVQEGASFVVRMRLPPRFLKDNGVEHPFRTWVEFSRPVTASHGILFDALAGFGIAALLAFVVAVAAGLLMARYLGRPVRTLALYAASLQPGVEPAGFLPSGPREIRDLGAHVRDMAVRLNDSNHKLETERDSLRTFLADASHELRSPMTALTNFFELLSGSADQDPERRMRYLEESGRQLDRMGRIVTRLLDMARLESGVRQLHEVNCDIGPIILSAVNLVEQVQLTFLLPDKVMVRVDQEALDHVLSNILDNASRYGRSPDGTLLLEISSHIEASGKHSMVTIAFTDQGSGIFPEDLERLSQRGFRARRADGQANASEGFGIGLSLVRAYTEAMGGRLSIESPISVDGRGTRVSISLTSP